MSFNGIAQFNRNLRLMMDSKAFKKADQGARMSMGGLLLRSKYGAPIIGETKPLKKQCEKWVSTGDSRPRSNHYMGGING